MQHLIGPLCTLYLLVMTPVAVVLLVVMLLRQRIRGERPYVF